MSINASFAIFQPMSRSDRFGAFISYRHLEPDRGIAHWLHAALETYRVPSALVRAGIRPRLGRVFRDEEELAASADLSGRIDNALDRADAIVVICSPNTPPSRWVDAEIQRFAALGRADRIFAVLLAGEPAESFPRALLALGKEPLAADLRPRAGESVKAVRRIALLKLLAGLLGVEFDALRQRDEERRRRRLAWAAGAGATLTALFAGLAVFAALQWQRAERELKVSRAQYLAAQAQIALAEASARNDDASVAPDAQRAALLALESLRAWPTLAGDRVLRSALFQIAPERFVKAIAEGTQVNSVSADGQPVLAAANEAAAAPEASPGTAAPDAEVLARSHDGRLLLRRSTEGVVGWVFETADLRQGADGPRIALLPHEWSIRLAAFAADDAWLVTVTGQAGADAADPSATALVGSTVRVWNTLNGQEMSRLSLAADQGIVDAHVDDAGQWLVTVSRAETGALVRIWPIQPAALRQLACSALNRNLSPSEWLTFVAPGEPGRTCPGLPIVSE